MGADFIHLSCTRQDSRGVSRFFALQTPFQGVCHSFRDSSLPSRWSRRIDLAALKTIVAYGISNETLRMYFLNSKWICQFGIQGNCQEWIKFLLKFKLRILISVSSSSCIISFVFSNEISIMLSCQNIIYVFKKVLYFLKRQVTIIFDTRRSELSRMKISFPSLSINLHRIFTNSMNSFSIYSRQISAINLVLLPNFLSLL